MQKMKALMEKWWNSEVFILITKTISGHYDSTFSISHNNRVFTPKNVDPNRTHWNYECVAAGQLSWLDPNDPGCVQEFWVRYRELSDIYWQNRSIAKTLAWERYQEHMRYMRRISYLLYPISHDPISAFIEVLLLPLIISCEIVLTVEQKNACAELEKAKEDQWLLDIQFNAEKLSLCEALHSCDREKGTHYLHAMDMLVQEMAVRAEDQLSTAQIVTVQQISQPRFATLEEIYTKLYEPSFRSFQNRQRPCRRYDGTYLQQIRENQQKSAKSKQQSKNAKSHKTAEAIEIVFGIGDMDNTGYVSMLQDAKQAETLLKDFCDHLLMQPNMCCVTSKELAAPNWQPPFRNGLIILNLTVHCDEATPGVHLTCIPYSRDCKRGPAVQAAMGRAMTGMGYPSTWKDVLDESGERIPKRTKTGALVHNSDGSVRYRQEPDKQGIIDWIEEQKQWLQKEMLQRYGWQREYKGSHTRGNLSTPDYKVARAHERKETLERETKEKLHTYMLHVRNISLELQNDVKKLFEDSSVPERVMHYLKHCPDEDYARIINEVNDFWRRFVGQEEKKTLDSLKERIKGAEKKAVIQNFAGQMHTMDVKDKELFSHGT